MDDVNEVDLSTIHAPLTEKSLSSNVCSIVLPSAMVHQ